MVDSEGYLTADDLAADPLEQFDHWFRDAGRRGQMEVESGCLSTATTIGVPSGRIVLLKGYGPDGFTFFTNYTSRKAAELEANPRAALTFYWPAVSRQVLVEGTAARVSRDESRSYFDSRPYESRLAAWASKQSSPLGSRELLDERIAELKKKYPETAGVPLPPFWGGYRIVPEALEFWQQGPNRLHDRFRYERRPDGWTILRLNP